MFLLDTNVISELRKITDKRTDQRFVNWARQCDLDECFVSVITIAEIERDILLRERKDAKQGTLLRHWVESQRLPEFDGRVLEIDSEIALRFAHLNVPHPRPWADCWIAATAYVHKLRLVTRNIQDFRGLGIELLNPWES